MATAPDQSGLDSLRDFDLDYFEDLPIIDATDQPLALADLDIGATDLTLLQESVVTECSPEQEAAAEWTHMLNDRDLQDLDYTDFESWIPEFERPLHPCDYCRSKHLECYKRKQQSSCYACQSLFRDCSLASTTTEAVNYASDTRGTFFDALHTLDEDACIEQGTRATIKFLNSKTHLTGSLRPQPDDVPGSDKRNGIRFPRHAVKILRSWLEANLDHPYPTGDEKTRLEETTGLKPAQIANWLANARRRRKILEKSRPRRCLSPSLRCPTPAIDIVAPDSQWDNMNPLERWKHSPPENEPAAITDIVNAVVNADLPDAGTSTPSSVDTRRRKGSSNGSGLSARRATSTTSAETSRGSSGASSAAYSLGSSRGSFGSFSSNLGGKKDRRRRTKRQAPNRQINDDKKRMFQCTFCTDTFKSKYDWTRHEKTLHLSLEKWICAPLGPCVIDQANGEKMCVFCGLHNPPDKHEETHNHSACEEKGLDSRTFYRKDHLRQHLRLFHGCDLTPAMEAWKFTTTNINSRCGFCAQRFITWQERVDHLNGHFRGGTRMTDWRGCRGFDPAIAAQVTNAMPPYLIGIEALSPNPFSATNPGTLEHYGDPSTQSCQTQHAYAEYVAQSPDAGLPPKATCWEILTIRLGRFANEMNAQGLVITDEMLQGQARQILYGSDDSWNQTAADNPEWLDLFKKAHGLDYIPSLVGGQGENVPEDLEWYQDLGMRIPFFVQLEQYNKFQREMRVGNGELRPQQKAETSRHLLTIVKELSADGILHGPQVICAHVDCGDNLVTVEMLDADDKVTLQQIRWCNETLTPATTGKLAKFIGLVHAGIPVAFSQGGAPGESQDAIRAAKARAACLEQLQLNEVDCCPFLEQNDELAQRRAAHNARLAKNKALSALSRAEGKLSDGDTELAANLSVYLPRHKATLPYERAKRFATVTDAWEDSGAMPKPYSTASLQDPNLAKVNLEANTTSVSELMYGEKLSMASPQVALPIVTDAICDTSLDSTDTLPWSASDGIPALTSAELSSIIEATSIDLGIEEMDFNNVFDTLMEDTSTM